MQFGDVLYVAAFIVLPLLIVAASIMALRSLGRGRMIRRATFESQGDTAELPIPPRDWAASVRPTRHQGARHTPTPESAPRSRPFQIPAYRTRSGGIVRRLNIPARRHSFARPVVMASSPMSATDRVDGGTIGIAGDALAETPGETSQP